MNRREILKGIGLILGSSISAPVAAAALDLEERRPSDLPPGLRTLDLDQDRLVTALAETIIPATDTPGAAAAGVSRFIDLLLTEWLEAEEVQEFLTGLAAFEAHSVAATGEPFADLSANRQLELLEPLDRQATSQEVDSDRSVSAPAAQRPFLAVMKEMTLVGYYTSEIGMTQELRAPGISSSYHGCIPYEEIGRSWA